jgi:hypothetical protein
MGISNPRNVGAHIADVVGIIPQAFQAGNTAPNTAGKTLVIDRAAYNYPQSMTVHLNAGQTSSNPSVATVQSKVFTSDDGTTFANYVPPPINGQSQGTTQAATPALDCHTAPASAELDVDLSGCGRYVALDLTAAFTGGTTPAIVASAKVTLGGAAQEPI